jgi:hypothetical protein
MPGVVRQFPTWDYGLMRLNLFEGGAVTNGGCTQDTWKRLFDWLPSPSVETEHSDRKPYSCRKSGCAHSCST